MGNALKQDLRGKVVLVRLPEGLPAQRDELRKFHCTGGFGCRSYTVGTLISGRWTYDGRIGAIDGTDVEAIVEEKEP
jgi:hypothetical protein